MEFFNTFLKGFNGKISSISSWKHYVLTAQVPKCILMELAHKKNGTQKIGRSRGGLTTKIHMVTASDRAAVSFSLSSMMGHHGK